MAMFFTAIWIDMKRLSVYVLIGLFGLYEITTAICRVECPDRSQWRIKAKDKCGKTVEYHCLYNQTEGKYIELCSPAKEFVKGRKVVYAGKNLDAPLCSATTFMPFNFVSNMGHRCLIQKSLCNEEGQLPYRAKQSTSQDSVCICDFLNGYEYVDTNLSSSCNCDPSEEDCSCYKKPNPDDNKLLSADDKCILKTDSADGIDCKIPIIREDKVDNSNINHIIIEITDKNLCILIIAPAIVMAVIGIAFIIIEMCPDTDTVIENSLHGTEKSNEITSLRKQQNNTTECSSDKQYLDVGEIIRIQVPFAKLECYINDDHKLKSKLENEPRILDMCFLKDHKKMYILYIDADNIDTSIVIQQISGGNSWKRMELSKPPNRLAKLGDDLIALIYKDDFNILIRRFNFENMEFDLCDHRYNLKKEKIGEKGIQGIAGISAKHLIVSNRSNIFELKIGDKKPVTPKQFSIKKSFDTARRLAILKGKDTLVFIADENDKKIVCIDSEGNYIDQRKSHDRALQNVRGIAVTKDKLFAATSEGVCVFNHTGGKFEDTNKKVKDPFRYSPILVKYLKPVSHARCLCIAELENKIYLGLSFVINRKDRVIVFSFDKNNLSNFNLTSE